MSRAKPVTFRRITIVLGSAALILFGWRLGWANLLSGVLRLGPTGWLAVLGLQLIAFSADAWSLKACAGPWSAQLSFAASLRACIVAQAVNTVTPFGQLGEAHKLRRLPAAWPAAIRTGTVLLHNDVLFLGTCASVAVGLVVGALAMGQLAARYRGAAFLAAAVCLGAGVAVHALVMNGPGARARGLIDRIGARWPRMRRLGAAAGEATAAASLLARGRSTLPAVAATMVKRGLLVLEALIVLRSLSCPSPASCALLSSGGSQLVTWGASFVPAQVGAAEAGSMLLFQMLGVSATIGLSLEIVRRSRRLVMAAIGLTLA